MNISAKMRYILAAVGGLCACISLVIVFTVPVFAACSARVECPGGGDISCSCSGTGGCVSGSNWVQCNCADQPPMTPACCAGTCTID